VPEYNLFLVCRNIEYENRLRKFLLEAGTKTGIGVQVLGSYRTAEGAGDYLALLGAAGPQALLVDASVDPEKALQLASQARLKVAQLVTLIGIGEKDFDFLQRAIALGVEAVFPAPIEEEHFCSRLHAIMEERQREVERLASMRSGGTSNALADRMRGKIRDEDPRDGPLLSLAEQIRGGTTLAFVSSKDGEGKSTVALNLGISLAQKFAKRVIYLDLGEVLSETAMMLNRKAPGTFHNLLGMKQGEFTSEGIRRFAIDYFEDGSFLAICGNPSIEAPEIDRDALDLLLRFLKSQADFVILDCPVRFDVTLKTALKLADWHVVVVQNSLSSLRNTQLYLGELRRLEYPSHQVRIVLNRVSATAGLSRESLEEHLGPYPVVTSVVSNGPVAIDAINVGVPVVQHAPDSDLAECIHAFSKRLLGIETSEVGATHKFSLGSMISSFLKRD
jgi:Flp pilus assembly CpaE family ATPase